MFTSQSLRAVAEPGALAIVERRLGAAVRQLELRGTLGGGALGELAGRVDAALAAGVRWLIVDLAETATVADEALDALVAAGRRLRARKGELIVAGAPEPLARRLAEQPVAHRPAQVPGVDQAIMILKLLRPGSGPPPRGKQRLASLVLPRIEPTT